MQRPPATRCQKLPFIKPCNSKAKQTFMPLIILLVLCVPVVPMFSLSIKILQTNVVQTMLMAKGEKTNSNALPKHPAF